MNCSQTNLSIAEAYYRALGEKDIDVAEKFLHTSVQCAGPLVKIIGKKTGFCCLRLVL